MKSLKHCCENCDTEFRITYNEEYAEDKPTFCPFCAEMIIDQDEDDIDVDL